MSVTQTDDRLWELDRPLWYWHGGYLFAVPAGYVTDFATVPRLVWWLIPTYGNYTPATVLHDAAITEYLPRGEISSREVDRMFRDAMRSLGVSFPRRWLMWAGVRWGALFNSRRRGGWSWTKDAPAVALISLLALPLLLPAVVLLPSLLAFALIERLTT